MALNAEHIAGHAALHGCVRAQAPALIETYEANPRLASVFATQQRWLMARIGLALHFRRDPRDYREYMSAQAVKLAIIDAAFAACLPALADG